MILRLFDIGNRRIRAGHGFVLKHPFQIELPAQGKAGAKTWKGAINPDLFALV